MRGICIVPTGRVGDDCRRLGSLRTGNGWISIDFDTGGRRHSRQWYGAYGDKRIRGLKLMPKWWEWMWVLN